jgi:type II secretory pathway pseudopilin PulG
MKHSSHRGFCLAGVSLIESLIALGVLAVAIPAVLAVMTEAGKSGLASQAETRSTWMIPACLDEIRASRGGSPQYFSPTASGQAFPPPGELWALAFSPEGRPIGKLPRTLYSNGIRELDGQTVRYIASLASSEVPGSDASARLLNVRISLEYPAASPETQRRKLVFHTRMP